MLRRLARSWLQKVLAVLGLLVVVPTWAIAKVVDELAHSISDHWCRSRFRALTAKVAEGVADSIARPVRPGLLISLALFAIATLVFWSIMGPAWAISAAFFLTCASAWLFAFPPAPEEDVTAPRSYPRTTWRLCDPELSTHGLWRAEFRADLSEIETPARRKALWLLIQELIGDWSFRSGWPYYHSRVLGATRSDPRSAGPFSSVANSSRVYRVRLDVGESGWVHFGEGYVEFQLEPPARRLQLAGATELPDRKTGPWSLEEGLQPAVVPRETEPEQARLHPLWDRWLDR